MIGYKEKLEILIRKHKFLFIIIGSLMVLVISIFMYFINIRTDDVSNDSFVLENTESKTKEMETIVVDIKGAIHNPGVYTLKSGSRVEDAIKKGGGLREDADTAYINLSKQLKDEMVIIIYTKDEISSMVEGNTTIKYIDKECICPTKSNDACLDSNKVTNQKEKSTSSSSTEIGIININTASLSDLQKLPSIGEAKAKLIVEYRKTKLFEVIEDIKNVKGIGDSIFEKIKTYITT